jgi:hypothetical protein
MAISEKTRKVLWGRSGNRCASCRRELVVHATTLDEESVVGEECHMVSPKANGPRHDPAFLPEDFDEIGNLILLCRVHHKMVDDQCDTYPVEKLRQLKSNHERWVSTTLTGATPVPPVRIRRIEKNIPSHLTRLVSGREMAAILSDALGYSFQHDDPQSDAETELIAGFLQEAQDWGDLWADLDAGDRVKATYRMGTLLRELEEAGLWVFGGREVQRLEGGIAAPSSFPVAIIRVVRSTNLEAIHLGAERPAVERRTTPDGSDRPTVSKNGDV